MTNTQLPDWFKGEVYEKGEVATNPYSQESIELNNVELSIYDFILGATMWLYYHSDDDSQNVSDTQRDLDKGIEWFKKVNPEAYIVLLD